MPAYTKASGQEIGNNNLSAREKARDLHDTRNQQVDPEYRCQAGPVVVLRM